jgi:peptide/nickel transport system substrate-binding protein
MTAQAVKDQFERSVKVGRGISHAWGKARFDAVDESTLVITTDHPLPLDLISSSQFAFIYSPSSAERGTDWFQKGNEDGTGPYKVVHWVPNQQIVLERNDAYWGGWKGGEPDRVIYRIVSEVSTQVQMLRSGEADLEFGTIPLNLVATLREAPDIKVEALRSYQNLMVAINTMKPPTDNLKFRQALSHIMDAKTVVKQIYAGFASAPRGPAPMVLPGAPTFDDMPQFDLALAKKLLDESGVPADQREITWGLYIGVDTMKDLALLFQANAATVGIKVRIIPVEQGVFTNRQRKQETSFNVAPHQWFPDYATIDPTLLFESQKVVSFNYSYYSDPAVDRWIDEGRTLEAMDKEHAAEVWAKAYHKAVIDDAAAMFLADMVNIVPHRANLEGVTAETTDPAYQTVFFYKLHRKGD